MSAGRRDESIAPTVPPARPALVSQLPVSRHAG